MKANRKKILVGLVLGTVLFSVIYAYAATISPDGLIGFTWGNFTNIDFTGTIWKNDVNMTAQFLVDNVGGGGGAATNSSFNWIVWRSGSTYYYGNGTGVTNSSHHAGRLLRHFTENVLDTGQRVLIKRGNYSLGNYGFEIIGDGNDKYAKTPADDGPYTGAVCA